MQIIVHVCSRQILESIKGLAGMKQTALLANVHAFHRVGFSCFGLALDCQVGSNAAVEIRIPDGILRWGREMAQICTHYWHVTLNEDMSEAETNARFK